MIPAFTRLSSEDRLRLEFMSEVEYIMQQVSHRHLGMNEGYERLMNLLGEKEFENVLQVLYNRERTRVEESI